MATTLANIIQKIRWQSNQEESFFVSDTELTDYINSSLGELYDIMCNTYEDYNINNFISNITSGNQISVPSFCMKIRGVEIASQSSSSPWVTLNQYQEPERNRNGYSDFDMFSNYETIGQIKRFKYEGNKINIIPQQQASGQYRVLYTPKYVNLINLTDQLTIQMDTNAWVQYAVIDCCIKINAKIGIDTSAFDMQKALKHKAIVDSLKNRNSSGPICMVNIRNNGNWGNGFGGVY